MLSAVDDIKRVENISKREWTKYFDDYLGLLNEEKQRYVKNSSNIEQLLSNKETHLIPIDTICQEDKERFNFKMNIPKYLYNNGEIYNLCIQKGTINSEEIYKINEHIMMTIKMLESLPFPKNLSKVPEYAGNHHENPIGTGYPRKLTKDEMSIPARMMALADVFEALTANDRPYKDAKKLSEAIKILCFMVKDRHIDEDIFELFIETKIYEEYAKLNLKEEQIDLEEVEKILEKFFKKN